MNDANNIQIHTDTHRQGDTSAVANFNKDLQASLD